LGFDCPKTFTYGRILRKNLDFKKDMKKNKLKKKIEKKRNYRRLSPRDMI